MRPPLTLSSSLRTGLSKGRRSARTVAAIGIFDGVHKGHQRILAKAAARARAIRGTPVTVTFHPHPATVLRPSSVLPLILSLDQRVERIKQCGIRSVRVVPFTRSFSRWPPEQFVRQALVRSLRVKEVVVGHDFRFGADRAGTTETLRELGRHSGFKTWVVKPVRLGGERVSSGRIRRRIQEGDLKGAERLLGAPVMVTGQVVRGSGRGAKLGFSTANLRIEAGVLPPPGVYAVQARWDGRWRPGMANLGWRPTFTKGVRYLVQDTVENRVRSKFSTGKITRYLTPFVLEVHVFNFHRRLYGRRLEVAFRRLLRPERRFPSAQALARQLKLDAARAKSVILKPPFGFAQGRLRG